MPRLLERLQGVLFAAAVAGLAVGFFASIGLRVLPLLDRTGFWVVVALLLLLGLGGGAATVVRAWEIDRRRWEAAEDPLITSGEREYAHKEAERERRWAGIVFFTSPIGLGYCAAYHLGPDTVDHAPAFLALLPVAAYLVGYLAAHAAQRVWLKAPP